MSSPIRIGATTRFLNTNIVSFVIRPRLKRHRSRLQRKFNIFVDSRSLVLRTCLCSGFFGINLLRINKFSVRIYFLNPSVFSAILFSMSDYFATPTLSALFQAVSLLGHNKTKLFTSRFSYHTTKNFYVK